MVASLFDVLDLSLLGDTMKIHLPYPVSVNAMYKNCPGRGRAKTGKYNKWIKAAAAALQGTPGDFPLYVPGKVQIHITVKRPDNRKRDIDNLAKGILDFLVNYELIDDDRNVEKLIIEWVYEGPEGATITIEGI